MEEQNNGKVTIAVLKRDVEVLTKTVDDLKSIVTNGFDTVEKGLADRSEKLEIRIRENEKGLISNTQQININCAEINTLRSQSRTWNIVNSLGALGGILTGILSSIGVHTPAP